MSDTNKSHPHGADTGGADPRAQTDDHRKTAGEPNDAAQTGERDAGQADAEDAVSAAAAEAAADHAATEQGFDTLEGELADMRDRVLRAVADAENTRKRAAKEVSDAKAYALTAFARDLLGVADNMDRALQAVSPAMRDTLGDAVAGLVAGIEMTRKELHDALARNGVKPIPSEPGDRFDPNRHQAVAQIPSDVAKDCIVSAVQSGWVIGDRTLRAAMVAVSAGPANAPAPAATHATVSDATGDETQDAPTTGTEEPESAPKPGGRIDTTI